MFLQQFALRDYPFRLTPDARLVYSHPAFAAALAALLSHVLLGRTRLILLLGDTGTGKTVLLQRLRDLLEAAGSLVFFFPRAILSGDALLDSCCREAGIAAGQEDRAERVAALAAALGLRADAGEPAALLIDEAQNLDEDMLHQLPLLGGPGPGGRWPLPTVLAGSPALEALLDRSDLPRSLRDGVLRVRLGPLDRQDIARYIAHRLQAAGHHGGTPFTPEAVERIARYSRGVPRLINHLCSTALLIAMAQSEPRVTAGTVEQAAVGCAMAGKGGNEGPPAALPDRPARAAVPLAPYPPPAAARRWGGVSTRHAALIAAGLAVGIGAGYAGYRTALEAAASRTVPAASAAPAETVADAAGAAAGAGAADGRPVADAAPVAGVAPDTGRQADARREADIVDDADVVEAVDAGGAADGAASAAAPADTTLVLPASLAPPAAPLAAERLVARGDALLATGDLAAARLFYGLAAGQGSAAAATRIGMTYDPAFFAEAGVRGMTADPAKAAEWYRKAANAGDPEAAARLHRLVP